MLTPLLQPQSAPADLPCFKDVVSSGLKEDLEPLLSLSAILQLWLRTPLLHLLNGPVLVGQAFQVIPMALESHFFPGVVFRQSLQDQINQLRNDVFDRFASLEASLLARIGACASIESFQSCASIESVQGLGALVRQHQATVAEAQEDVRGEIDSMVDAIDQLQGQVSVRDQGIGSAKQLLGDEVNLSVRAITRSVVHFLYGVADGLPLPPYPPSGTPWPTSDPSNPASNLLHFDLAVSPTHERNLIQIERVADWIIHNRTGGVLPADSKDIKNIQAVDRRFFKEACIVYVRSLRKSIRAKQAKADRLAASTFIDGVTSMGVTKDISKETFTSRRKITSETVQRRRRFIRVYSGPELEILDQPASQINEDDGPGNGRRWCQEQWMSPQCAELLKAILMDRSVWSGKANEKDYTTYAVSDRLNLHPIYPVGEVERRLQQWQFDPAYLELHGYSHRFDIVPVDKPTSFEDVKQLEWWKSHPSRKLTTKEIGANLLGSRKRKAADVPVPATPFIIDGLDIPGSLQAAMAIPDNFSSTSQPAPPVVDTLDNSPPALDPFELLDWSPPAPSGVADAPETSDFNAPQPPDLLTPTVAGSASPPSNGNPPEGEPPAGQSRGRIPRGGRKSAAKTQPSGSSTRKSKKGKRRG